MFVAVNIIPQHLTEFPESYNRSEIFFHWSLYSYESKEPIKAFTTSEYPIEFLVAYIDLK